MHLHEEVPPLNPWPFLIGDAALLATACLISSQTRAPLTGLPLVAIAGCVALGAVLAVIPFLINHTRRQELALAERQREIAALAQITTTSAEQISIAASGLHSIAESTARSLKLGEQLPHKIQEKINDFKTQLNEVVVTENEALAQEINTLRSNETERLETALSGVRKTATDLAMIETVNRKHLSDLNESLTRFIISAEKAASDAAKTIEAARGAAEKSIAAALDQIDHKIAAVTEQTIRRPLPLAPEVEIKPIVRNLPQAVSVEPSDIALSALPPAEKKPDSNAATATATPPLFATASTVGSTETLLSEEKILRKRPPRKPTASDNELMLGIDIPSSETSEAAPTDSAPSVSSDGLTRLLVTAYIGIGNKLFVRGDGPGLNWDRGVPLQFVSIGKWRWESADATTPVTLKLYKNDEHECAAVGTVTLTPGQQQQVTASFN
jgi:regulator of replication initiation timing